MEVKARAPGKIILAGEHAVVHGSTAVAASVNLYTTASVRLPCSSVSRIKEALGGFVGPISTPTSCPAECLKAIASLVEYQNIPEAKIKLASGVSAFLWLYSSILRFVPVDVAITSELPLGSGLGSSAAFCVAISAALLALSGSVNVDQEQCGWMVCKEDELVLLNKWAFEGSLDLIKSNMPLKMLVTNTKVGRNTKALVAGVSERAIRHPDAMSSVFNAVDSISKELSILLQSLAHDDMSLTEKEEQLAELMEMNQGLLQCMGVSHGSIETILRTTSKYELVSKLTGAGGGGCVLTLLPNLLSGTIVDEVIAELESCGFECFIAGIGGKGAEISFHDLA
ncbi:Mevalonate kinase, partial [Cucurbita argyrosperma subsp. argyrosperma]